MFLRVFRAAKPQPIRKMKTVIVQMNVQAPLCGMFLVMQPQPQKTRRAVRLIDHHGVPAELAYAAACTRAGCDCSARLGRN